MSSHSLPFANLSTIKLDDFDTFDTSDTFNTFDTFELLC
jgi:hypothetical protein